MATILFMVLILMVSGHSRVDATWCICKEGMSDSALQRSLDYACGAGADCNPIHQNGPCFNPNTVRAHCNYAVNSYFQRKGQATGSCDFSGTATVITSDPSTAGCVYPGSASTVNTTPTSTTTPTTTTNTPGRASPYTTTPTTGVLGGGGGVGTGLGPSGPGMNTDLSHGGLRLGKSTELFTFLTTMMLSAALVFLWG